MPRYGTLNWLKNQLNNMKYLLGCQDLPTKRAAGLSAHRHSGHRRRL